MGTQFFDQYMYLHFATGIISYFFGISLSRWIIFHTIFEIVENTAMGLHIINNYFTFWPGGKLYPDKIINRIGDTFGTILGWTSAYYLDKIGNANKWHVRDVL